jgi:hypothetical protein
MKTHATSTSQPLNVQHKDLPSSIIILIIKQPRNSGTWPVRDSVVGELNI